MANTFTLISSVTVGSGGAADISFTSIPATYTDLNLVISTRSLRSNVDDELLITFNSSTSNYSWRRLLGENTASSDNSTTRVMIMGNGNTATANTFASSSVYIPNYAGSNYKSLSIDAVSENNASTAPRQLVAGLWSDTAAITSIALTSNTANNFMQYSTAYLYGISNA